MRAVDAGAPGRGLVVVLVPNEDGRPLTKAEALTGAQALADGCPQIEISRRIGWSRFVVVSRATQRELLDWAVGAIAAVPAPIVVGIGVAEPKPVESLSVLELGTNEAANEHPSARVFVLDEDQARVIPAPGSTG